MGFFGNKKPFFAKCRAVDPAVLEEYGRAFQVLGLNSQFSVSVAVFGDVHANLEALEAVLADAKKQGV